MYFSVVIPVHNKQSCIGQTIRSVLNQTHGDFELVVVDDGSTDGTLQEVKTFSDERIRVIEKPNGGVSSARNAGLAAARYDWVAFLDGDDVWSCFHLEVLAKLSLEYPEAQVLCTNYATLSSDEDFVEKLATIEQSAKNFIVKDLYRRLLEKKHITHSSTTAVWKGCFEKVGGFNESLTKGEDLDVWERLYDRFTFAQTDFVTAFYRLDAADGSATRTKGDVRSYQVYYFHPDWKKGGDRTLYHYRVIYNYLKHFLAFRQWKNFLLLCLRYNLRLLPIPYYRMCARRRKLSF